MFKVVYTEEEKEGLYIVRAICAAEVDPMRLTERDTKAYCGIILDGNSRKYFIRMYFNATIKKIEIFDNAEPADVQWPILRRLRSTKWWTWRRKTVRC